MRRLALLAAFVVAVPVPAAASHALAACKQTPTGLSGYVVSARRPPERVSIRCLVMVDGVAVTGTPTASGTAVAVTTGGGIVPAGGVVCAAWTAGLESATTCDF